MVNGVEFLGGTVDWDAGVAGGGAAAGAVEPDARARSRARCRRSRLLLPIVR